MKRYFLGLILGLLLLSGFSSYSQTNGSFKSVRFYQVGDSARFLSTTWANFITAYPNAGGMYYNEQSDKFRLYENGAWRDLGGSGGGGSTPPAGSNTEIQFNNAGAFGADTNLTYLSASNILGIASGADGVLLAPTVIQFNGVAGSTSFLNQAINANNGIDINSTGGGATGDLYLTGNSLARVGFRANGGVEVLSVTGETGQYKIHIEDANISGTAAPLGVATLVGGTVTVSNTSVQANSRIFLTVQTAGGTQGFLRIQTITPGTSFVITSTSATETSIISYFIVTPQ